MSSAVKRACQVKRSLCRHARYTVYIRTEGAGGSARLHPRRNAGYVTCAQAADKTKCRKCGSSVAYKTIGTFLSKVKRKDARG